MTIKTKPRYVHSVSRELDNAIKRENIAMAKNLEREFSSPGGNHVRQAERMR